MPRKVKTVAALANGLARHADGTVAATKAKYSTSPESEPKRTLRRRSRERVFFFKKKNLMIRLLAN